MRNLERKIRMKLHKDDHGSAMVMVIVIIAFIAILASVLMFVTYAGYQMRLMDRSGKDNFYTAETVLDEINVGLQSEISDAIAEAYEDVMRNYALYDTAQKRSNRFYELYMENLNKTLRSNPVSGGEVPAGSYSVEHLRSYLSPEIIGDGVGGSREGFGTFGAIVESNLNPASYMLASVSGEGILLKDLKVTYVDERGYVSIISTDIRIILPDVNFTQASDLPDVNEYCLIADETLAMGNDVSGGGITIKGNAYAGRMTVGRNTDPSIPTMLPGSRVTFENVNGMALDNRMLVIAREDITINESAFYTKGVQLWGSNLVLSSSDTKLEGSTNLRNDLVLAGVGSKAVLVGEYCGFGMPNTVQSSPSSGDGEDTEDTLPAQNSAIIVNGRDSELDLSGLENMTIAGHAYVKTAVNANIADGTTSLNTENKKNVIMGESVAVKSNQLIYLAPAEALGCGISKNGAIEESVYGCNPLTLEQYEEIVNNPDKYLLLDGNRQIAALGYKSLDSYISQETLADGTAAYVPEVIFRQTNAGPLVYCYLKFTDEEKANQYFRDYYSVNTEKVNQYMQLYAKEIKMPDPYSMLYLNLAGNMLVSNADAEDPASVLAATDSYESRRQSQSMSVSKSIIYSALSAKIVTNVSQLTVQELERTAFQNIIDDNMVRDILYECGNTSTVKISSNEENPMAANAKTALITSDDYTIDSSTPSYVHMVISLGNVEVRKDFEGLIIAGGNVSVVSGGGNLELTPLSLEDFSEIMNASIHVGDKEYWVLDVFRDGKGYSITESGGLGTQTEKIMLADLIIYERWSKR